MAEEKPDNPMAELGVAGAKMSAGIPWDDFIQELNGTVGIKKFREMRDNDPVIGAIMQAMEMMIRRVEWRQEPANDSQEAAREAEWLSTVWEDMEGTWEDFVSQSLSFFSFGWSVSEKVYKVRRGPSSDPTKNSKFNDGRIGLRKIAHRAQTTFYAWGVNNRNEAVSFQQWPPYGGKIIEIPLEKLVHFKTASITDSPMGRSCLRNAYRPYYYASHIENIEAIAIERELNGLPVFKVPSSVLKDSEKLAAYERIARDVKRNEQGYMIHPSDLWADDEGNLSSTPKVSFELVASNGSRDIDTSKVITRYRQDIARTVLADFVMLGQGERGSFALSRDKSDLFLASLEGYLNQIASTINRQIVHQLWSLNGLNPDLMPKMVPGDVAPVDLQELGEYIQRISGAGFPIFPDNDIEQALLESANLPSSQRKESEDMLGSPVGPGTGAEDDSGLNEEGEDG